MASFLNSNVCIHPLAAIGAIGALIKQEPQQTTINSSLDHPRAQHLVVQLPLHPVFRFRIVESQVVVIVRLIVDVPQRLNGGLPRQATCNPIPYPKGTRNVMQITFANIFKKISKFP
jgi:hypothetical protein